MLRAAILLGPCVLGLWTALACLVVWGMLGTWHQIMRYRLAVGFAGLLVGFGIIRFISLHEVIAWNAAAPWASALVDLIAATGVSALAIARLLQLSEPAGWRHQLTDGR